MPLKWKVLILKNKFSNLKLQFSKNFKVSFFFFFFFHFFRFFSKKVLSGFFSLKRVLILLSFDLFFFCFLVFGFCFFSFLSLSLSLSSSSFTSLIIFISKKKLKQTKQKACSWVVPFVACGRHADFNFLVMELLGENIAELRRLQQGRFTMTTTLKLGIQMIKGIESVHDLGYLHRDIKPSNFAMGLTGNKRQTCFLIDFGLARRYMLPDGEIRPPRDCAGFRGTARYASIHSHQSRDLGRFFFCFLFFALFFCFFFAFFLFFFFCFCLFYFFIYFFIIFCLGLLNKTNKKQFLPSSLPPLSLTHLFLLSPLFSPHRRDDLWSVLYLLIEFALGQLPWRRLRDKDKVGEMKVKCNNDDLVAGLPEEFLLFMRHLTSLQYQSRPDYAYLINMFENLYTKLGGADKTPFDWEMPLTHHVLRSRPMPSLLDFSFVKVFFLFFFVFFFVFFVFVSFFFFFVFCLFFFCFCLFYFFCFVIFIFF